MTQEEQNAAELVAALGDHEVTDQQGQVAAPDAAEEINTPETKPTVPEPAQVEKPAVKDEPAPKAGDTEDQDQLAEDETGKRYIPKERFDQVYGKAKATERELAQLKQQLEARPGPTSTPAQPVTSQPTDRTEALEVEILKGKLPQFDPDSDQYSPELDQLGAEIYKANPGITKVDAARRALNYAKKVSTQVADVKAEARTVKAIQSDPGITNRVVSRDAVKADPAKMSLEDQEAWLKANNAW